MRCWTTTTKTYTASSSSHRREEQCPQAPGAKRLLLRPGGGPEGLCGPAPQARQVCPDPEELRGLQETANERLFLMKDLAAVEEAAGLDAKIVEAEKIKSQLFP